MKQNVFDILDGRGFIKQTVFKDDLYKLLGSQSVTFYCGLTDGGQLAHRAFYPAHGGVHYAKGGAQTHSSRSAAARL